MNDRHPPVTRRRLAPGPVLLALLASALLPGQDPATPESATPEPTAEAKARAEVESARAMLEKWVEARRQISAARADWRVEKEALAERVAVLRQQIEAQKARIEDADKSLAAADQQRQKLLADGEKTKAVTTVLEAGLTVIEDRTRKLLVRLPAPIRQQVAPVSQQFADPSGEAKKLSLGARFGNVLGVLNLVHKWNRDVVIHPEVQELPGGASAEVSCLYFGLGQGFYVSAKGDAAGIGFAGPDGWKWLPMNDAAAAIQQAIDVYSSKQAAAFVPLPVKVQ